ncbi:hypothetical protein GCM10009677_54760 [Sphaerisporangium rubeum]|uniref:Uncharacterized protein n=1 Tax=Sphaerisporangium rubeum TaxID=321317 RepID=A0A7X0I901_9ACTN|nr:hypothetical protein [Sphaerisporangium rubeum]MBB6470846.1 hypothetical protein [Sphaerisporangium rubeum]
MAEDLTFVGYRRPTLPFGEYTVAVRQELANVAPATTVDTTIFETSRSFTVGGDRFTLPPGTVRSVFPPDGSLGEHSEVLPHIVLERPTLPWERVAGPGSPAARPWLALLVFSGDEQPPTTTVTAGTLASGGVAMPAQTLERGQAAADPVNVIDVPRALAASILPAPDDLARLAHVRRAGDDLAVVIANRLPAAGVSSTVHLVSVEGRYGATGFDLGTGGPVRLVTLASWRFSCLSDDHTFPYLVRSLAKGGRPFRLPDSGEPAAEPFLRQGYVPVAHRLRQGGVTASWYRGPFVTGEAPDDPRFGVRTSDELLRYHPSSGMLDVGYAAAWQLGRMLTLQHTTVGRGVYTWKRRRAMADLRDEPSGHPLEIAEIDDAMPGDVTDFLGGLATLRGVPYRYLVPDERLLPDETIRFLRIDPKWIAHLLDGATSIGRVTSADAERDRRNPPKVDTSPVTGALIRSALIPGYPGLLIDGYGDAAGTDRLTLLRSERLSPTVLLCLFCGELGRLDLRQPPEEQHFAVEVSPGRIGKTLRAADGSAGASITPLELGASRTVPVTALAGAMATALGVPATTVDSAVFARHMIETAERVTFVRT